MAPTFQVLKCYKCLVFQVHQTKKSNKFECKLCGEKQSIKRHYGLGNGKECRLHVQKLNGYRGVIEDLQNSCNESSDEEIENRFKNKEQNYINSKLSKRYPSKWLEYVESTEEPTEKDNLESQYIGTTEVVGDIPRKRQKKSKIDSIHLKDSPLITGANFVVDTVESGCDDTASNNVQWPKDMMGNVAHLTAYDYNNTGSKKYYQVEPREEKSITKLESLNKEKYCRNNNKFAIQDPSIIKPSKWMQFVEDNASVSVAGKDENHTNASAHNNTCSLFSLCDDSEIDNVLDI